MDAEFSGYKLFKPVDAQRIPGDFSWIGFQQGDSRQGIMTKDELISNIKILSADRIYLNLSGNALGRSEPTLLPELLTTVSSKSNISQVDLSYNKLCDIEPSELANNFKRLTTPLEVLNINNNKLGNFSFTDFMLVILAIPSTVKKIIISNNLLTKYPPVELDHFLSSFNDRVQTSKDMSLAEKTFNL